MRDKQKSTVKVVPLVLVVTALIAEVSGVGPKIRHMVFRPRASSNHVSESAIDTDGDGRPDLWEVNIRAFEPLQCSYILKDADHDGMPDALTVTTVNRIVCEMFDDDGDGRFDRQVVAIADVSDEHSRYEYQDLDLDGGFDKMVQKYNDEAIAVHLIMDTTMLRALPFPAYDPRAAWVAEPDGSQRMMVFENGGWKLAGE